jgi:hypothetical protein
MRSTGPPRLKALTEIKAHTFFAPPQALGLDARIHRKQFLQPVGLTTPSSIDKYLSQLTVPNGKQSG